MQAKSLPPQDLLNHLFSYDPENGVLTWENPTSRSMKPGDIAGTLHIKGYIYVGVEGEDYRAHRVIWKMQHGIDPRYQLDHINRKPADNRLDNLREATDSIQQRNRSMRRDNTSGTTGVRERKDGRKKPWRARITNDDGKVISKYFKTEAEAISQRQAWEIEFNYIGE